MQGLLNLVQVNMAVLKRYTVSFIPNTIKHKQVIEDGPQVVSEVEYTINAHETANSSNTLEVSDQHITFNYLERDTSDSGFVDIDDVNDDLVATWISDHFEDKEIELNTLLTYVDTGFISSLEDDIDLNNPYG